MDFLATPFPLSIRHNHVTKMLISHVNHIRKHTAVSEASSLPVREHLQTKLYPSQ